MEYTQENIQRLVKKYQRLMGLDMWEFAIVFGSFPPEADEEPASAACSADPEYLSASLFFDLERMKQTNDRPDACVRHEMLHAILWSIVRLAENWAGDDAARQEWVRTVEEHTTTFLERMPVWSVVKKRLPASTRLKPSIAEGSPT